MNRDSLLESAIMTGLLLAIPAVAIQALGDGPAVAAPVPSVEPVIVRQQEDIDAKLDAIILELAKDPETAARIEAAGYHLPTVEAPALAEPSTPEPTP